MPVVLVVCGLKRDVIEGALADVTVVAATFFSINCSPSSSPLVISVCVSFCTPIVTGMRVMIVVLDARGTDVVEAIFCDVDDSVIVEIDSVLALLDRPLVDEAL